MKKLLYLIVPAALAVILDQITKAWAANAFIYGETRPVTSFFNFTLVHNPGGAFGLLGQSAPGVRLTVFIVVVAIAVIALIWAFCHYYRKSRFMAVVFSLIIGGAVGNLIDRVRFGFVIDFLDFYVKGWHWPAFNVADICVTAGLALVIIYVLFERERN